LSVINQIFYHYRTNSTYYNIVDSKKIFQKASRLISSYISTSSFTHPIRVRKNLLNIIGLGAYKYRIEKSSYYRRLRLLDEDQFRNLDDSSSENCDDYYGLVKSLAQHTTSDDYSNTSKCYITTDTATGVIYVTQSFANSESVAECAQYAKYYNIPYANVTSCNSNSDEDTIDSLYTNSENTYTTIYMTQNFTELCDNKSVYVSVNGSDSSGSIVNLTSQCPYLYHYI